MRSMTAWLDGGQEQVAQLQRLNEAGWLRAPILGSVREPESSPAPTQ